MIHKPYPVIWQASLDPRGRRPFRGSSRGLPGQRPGTVLLVQIDDHFVAVSPRGTTMTGQLADATAAALVSLQRRTVTVAVVLPSRWEGTQFRVAGEFECQVLDAALMLQFGCWDLNTPLSAYLAGDPVVQSLAADADPLEVAGLRIRLAAHTTARNRVSPPFVPGAVCTLAHIDVRQQTAPESSAPEPSTPAGAAPQDYVWNG